MKLFLVVYGLVSIVPSSNGVWVLMPDTSRMHFEDGTPAARHFANVRLFPTDSLTPYVRTLAGDDLVLTGKGSPAEHEFLRKDNLFFYEDAVSPQQARANPDCIAPGSTCYRDGHNMLAGRLRLQGKVTLSPINVVGDWTLDIRDVYTNRWGVVEADTARWTSTREWRLGSAVAMMMEVDGNAGLTQSLWGMTGSATPQLRAETVKDQPACRQLAELFGDKPGANYSCILVFASNQPMPLYGKRTDHGDERDHSELLFSLFADQAQPRLAIAPRGIADRQGPGTPPGGTCTGGIMAATD